MMTFVISTRCPCNQTLSKNWQMGGRGKSEFHLKTLHFKGPRSKNEA